MRTTHPPGALLKTPTRAGITLVPSVQSRRLTEHLQDLIIIAYQRSTNLPGNCLSLIKSDYASAVEQDGKYCMRLNVLVKDHERDATIPLTVMFIVDSEDVECLGH